MSSNRCDTTCDCGLCFARRPEIGRRVEADLFTGDEYRRRAGLEHMPYAVEGAPGRRTLFGKVVCPLCKTEYLGYFCPPDLPEFYGPAWQIYDTSYWSSFNDEPGEADKRHWRDPVEALRILNESLERKGK
jgi:hypothetical protein